MSSTHYAQYITGLSQLKMIKAQIYTCAISNPRPGPRRIFDSGTLTFSKAISACPAGTEHPKYINYPNIIFRLK